MTHTKYTKDFQNHKLIIQRVFSAKLERVWQAWTEPAILEQWWAPKPWKAISHKMDFRGGGSWLYYMLGPDGTKSWCKADYKVIEPLKSYEGLDAFCDENGVINEEFPRMYWKVQFMGIVNGTQVDIEITFNSKEDLEKILELGFEEGFTAAHSNLDEIFGEA